MAAARTVPTDPIAELYATVEAAAAEVSPGGEAPAGATLERPPKPEMGDYSTNAAMPAARALSAPPREVAERLRDALAARLGERAGRVEVAGPGFVNLFLADRWYREAVGSVLASGERLGAGEPGGLGRAVVEFVSANPTGPLTAASGRHAAFGDSLVRIMERAGHEVERHYYLNDAGGQVRRFAESIAARMRGEEPPEDGYSGAYVTELAGELTGRGAGADDLDALERQGTELMRERIAATLERFRVSFDKWVSERALHEGGAVDAAIARLREVGHVYESEGAVWLRSTEFGDDKDRVLVRSGGEPTYFAADVAYHLAKLEGGGVLVDVLGADHHGYVPRMRAAVEALGADPERFDAVIMQLVRIVEGGERAQMSKREGKFVSLDELLDDIGVDAARYFLLGRGHDRTLDLDLELARRHSQDNPVYYVQYAHARIAGILGKAGEAGQRALQASGGAGAGLDAPLPEASERELVKRLLELPAEVRSAAEFRAPHRLGVYANATAADFHAFYRDCQVVGADGEGIEEARLALCVAAMRTIATALGLLGVSAPERM